VSIFASPPRTAWTRGISSTLCISLPDLTNLLLVATLRFMYRSPAGPPFIPPSPFPLSLIVDPLSTPAGILIFIVSFVLTLVVPWHDLHFFSGTFPSPLHVSHVRDVVICPRIVFLTSRTSPVPWQFVQFMMLLSASWPFPSHVLQTSGFVISSSFSHPNTASSNVIVIDASMSFPLLAGFLRLALCPPLAPPPKKFSNMSANPDDPPPENPEKSNPPPPPGNPPCPPALPNVSYC